MAVQALQAKLPVSIPPTAPAPPGSPKLRSFRIGEILRHRRGHLGRAPRVPGSASAGTAQRVARVEARRAGNRVGGAAAELFGGSEHGAHRARRGTEFVGQRPSKR